MTTTQAKVLTSVGLLAVVSFLATRSDAKGRRPIAPYPPPGTKRSEPCGQTGQELRTEYEAFLASRRQCKVTSDCDLAYAECPLPVYQAVAANAKRDVETLAGRLVQRAAAERCICVSDIGRPKVACFKQQCAEVRRD
jgi:hypothetical protein